MMTNTSSPTNSAAMAGLTMDDPEIHTCTFGLFGSISHVFKEDFGQYVPTLNQVMIEYIVNDEGVIAHRSETGMPCSRGTCVMRELFHILVASG